MDFRVWILNIKRVSERRKAIIRIISVRKSIVPRIKNKTERLDESQIWTVYAFTTGIYIYYYNYYCTIYFT